MRTRRIAPQALLALLPLLVQAQGTAATSATSPATPSTPLDTLMEADTSAFPDLGFLPRGAKDTTSPAPSPAATRRTGVAATPVADLPAAEPAGAAVAGADRSRRAGTHVLYENRPLPVALTLDAERVIDLPFVAMLQLPPTLEGKLQVQPIENVLYLTALAPFPRVRLLVQAVDGSAVLPLDVSAHAGQGTPERLPDLVIHLPGERPATDAAATVAPTAAGPDMAELTRFAAQSLYAPPRLIPASTRIRREQVAPELAKDLVRGGAVDSSALASWCAGKLCVTAVRLSNRGSVPLQLDPAMFRGRWVALTAQHWRLHGAGNAADTTAAYLVSDGRFADAR